MKSINKLSREGKAKINITTSLVAQLVTLICGFIIPRLMISYYGSETYGAVSSIAQFLGYIALLEGGICGVTRAALYKPLSDGDYYRVGQITQETSLFFRRITYVFFVYIIVIAFSYKFISNIECFDYFTTIILVFSISISTIAQYLFGITNSVFLQAAQKVYIINFTTIITIVINTAITIILVKAGFSIVIVKLVSSIVFVIKPLVFNFYVKKNYSIPKTNRNYEILSQKWDALGQHIAYFLHSNTDIVVLTIMSGLKNVAIYSVYNMIVGSLQNLVYAFSNGIEALFGDMIAKEEQVLLRKRFELFETLLSIISIFIFSVCSVMIVPFVQIYTSGFNDANYLQPFFATALCMAASIFCCRIPYHTIIIAAGQFKQTKWGAYGEAIINILSSIVLVNRMGLSGVAIGTVLACSFRFVYYAVFLKKNIVQYKLSRIVRRVVTNIVLFFSVSFLGYRVLNSLVIHNYFQWVLVSGCVSICALVLVSIGNIMLFKNETVMAYKMFFGKFFRRRL